MDENIVKYLSKVKPKISEFKEKRINEAQTINYLIRPFFETLGWDFSNSEEVIPEDSDASGKRPDFTFIIRKKIKLLVEAKPINNNLKDEKMISEKVNYCLSSGVPFLIITNGEAYKIYYSELKGASKDKLLNEFYLSDEDEHEIIELISKASFENNELLSYAKNIYVLNNIKKAIENLFGNPPLNLINIVNEKIKEIMGHKFGNDEVSNSLKQFTFSLTSDLSEIIEEKTKNQEDEKAESESEWTVSDQFKNGLWKNSYQIYNKLIGQIRDSNLDINERPTKRYIGLINIHNDNNFAQINGQKSKLRMWLKLDMEDLTEEEKLKVRDVSEIGHWGMGNTEFILNNEEDINVVLPLLKKAYNKE